MGVFNKTPYTNFHELNLNWIIKKIKEVAADNAYFKQFFKTIEDEHILGVVTKVTENNDNTVKTDYLNEDTQQMDNYTVYNKTGTDGAISGAISPIANRVTTAEGDIDSLETQMANAIIPYNNETNFATDLNALPLKAAFVRIGPDTLNSPLPSNQGYCLSIRSSASWGSQMAQTNNSEIVWVRRCQNGTWSSWQKLAKKSDIYEIYTFSGTVDNTGCVVTNVPLQDRVPINILNANRYGWIFNFRWDTIYSNTYWTLQVTHPTSTPSGTFGGEIVALKL